MFFSSVLTPSSLAAGRAQRDVGVAAQRALLHVHVADAQLAQRACAAASATRRPARRERRSGSVTISASGVPPRLKSTMLASEPWIRPLAPTWISLAASSSRCTRWMRTSPSRPPTAQRLVVLGDLVALGQVGIEVVLAVEDRARRELGAEREADHQPEVHGAGVGHGQAAGQPQADRAGARVGRLAEGQLAAAEHLRGGRELHVDLEADDRLVGVLWAAASAAGCGVRAWLRHGPPLRRSRSPARARGRRRAGGSR